MANQSDEYEVLIKPLEPKMIRSIWRIVRNGEDAQDALQEALATIWNRWGRIRKHPNPQALVLKICIDAACDALRRRIRLGRREASQTPSGQWLDPAPSAAQELARQELRAEILQAIGQLPRNQAEAILMRLVQELPYEAIAQAMGCAEATVRTHIARGRARLCQLLAHLAPAQELEVIK